MATKKRGRPRGNYSRNYGKNGKKTWEKRNTPVPKEPFDDRNWTDEQLAVMAAECALLSNISKTDMALPSSHPIIDINKLKRVYTLAKGYLRDGIKNLMVNAGPGCAKTTTITAGLHYAQALGLPVDKVTCGVFSNTAKDALNPKLPENCTASTVHSFGYRLTFAAWRQEYKGLMVQKSFSQVGKIFAEAKCGADDDRNNLRRNFITALEKSMMALATKPEHVLEVMAEHGIDSPNMHPDVFASGVISALNDMCKQPTNVKGKPSITFPFMVYGTYRNNWSPAPKDRFLLMITDECQDISPALRENLKKWADAFIFIGDRFQSIFHFAGADSDAVDNLVEMFDCMELPLMETFRLPKQIVERCNSVNPDLKAAEGNIDGEVVELGINELFDHLRPGDVVLSRKKAPLITMCFASIRRGLKANIINNDIGDMLVTLMRNIKADTPTELIQKTEKWKEETVAEYNEKGWATVGVVERADCLIALVQGLMRMKKNLTIRDITDDIDQRFKYVPDDACDKKDTVMFGTIHRSKGLEWKRVWILNDTYLSHPRMTPRDHEEESRIRYVGESRVQNMLGLVHGINLNPYDEPEDCDSDY